MTNSQPSGQMSILNPTQDQLQSSSISSILLLHQRSDPQNHPATIPLATTTNTTQEPHFSLILGISIGLLASFIQSLGLTIQRKSHLQNERLPLNRRRPDYARPVWLIGFTIYLSFNVLGSIFQIGTLPLIILGPLGAISLLWNAILARLLLADRFSFHLIIGTILIGLGALLIGLNGVLPDQSSSHDLDQLIYLYSRTPFLIEILLLTSTLSIICSFAHLYEFRLNQSLESISLLTISPSPTPPDPSTHSIPLDPQNFYYHPHHPNSTDPDHHPDLTHHHLISPIDEQPPPSHHRHSLNLPSHQPLSPPSIKKRRQDQNNYHHYPAYRARSMSSPTHYPLSLSFPNQPIDTIDSDIPLTPPFNHLRSKRYSHPTPKRSSLNHHPSESPLSIIKHEPVGGEDLPSTPKIKRLKLLIGIAYGSTSGILSGICLLFAKTGVELLIRTLTGTVNEFYKFQTWLILLVLLISALLQLWYLNKALRLVNPTLICPLAFCFYNLSTIISSLVYYDQLKLLSGFQVLAISLGTTILLGGVWVVSIGTHNSSNTEPLLSRVEEEEEDEQIVRVIEQEGGAGEEGVRIADDRSSGSASVVDEDEVTPLLPSSSRIENLEDHEGYCPEGVMDDSFDNEPDNRIRTSLLTQQQQQKLPPNSPNSCTVSTSPNPRKSYTHHPFDQLIRQFLVEGEVTPVRGFSIGLGAASPGFAIRPKRRTRTLDSILRRPDQFNHQEGVESRTLLMTRNHNHAEDDDDDYHHHHKNQEREGEGHGERREEEER